MRRWTAVLMMVAVGVVTGYSGQDQQVPTRGPAEPMMLFSAREPGRQLPAAVTHAVPAPRAAGQRGWAGAPGATGDPAATVAGVAKPGGARALTINHGSFGGAPYARVDATAVSAYKSEAGLIAAGGYASDFEYKTLDATLVSFDNHATYATDRGGCIYVQTVITGLQAGDIVEVDNNYFYDDGSGYTSFWDQAPYWILISPYTHNTTQTILNWLIYFYDAGGGEYTLVIGSGEYNLATHTDDLTTTIGDRYRLSRDVKVWQGATLLSPAVSGRGYTYSTVGISGGTTVASDALDQQGMTYVGEAVTWTDDSWAGSANGDVVGGRLFGQAAFAATQRAIDGAVAGGTVNVFPGDYDETAAGRYLYNGNGPYQFGLFIDKDGLTIQGVDAGGAPISDFEDVAAFVTTNATNSFGYSGTFVQADDVTITGLAFGPNAAGTNKTIEVIGDNFTIKYCRLEDRQDDVGGGSLYINDWRHSGSPGGAHVKSYHVEGNYFDYGVSVDLASGAGDGIGTRAILDNTFHAVDPDVDVYWALISFNGSGTGVPWFVHTVGGATVTGNTFVGGEQYIRARGTYDNGQFDWESFWENNGYERAVVTLVGDGDPFDVRTYSYTSGTYVFNDVRRIGGLIQGEVDHAVAGDTVLVAAGTYEESVVCKRSLTLSGAGCDATLWKAATATGIPLTIRRDSAAPANIVMTVYGIKFRTQQNQLVYASWNPAYAETLQLDVYDNCFEHINTPWDLYHGQDFGIYVYGASQLPRGSTGALQVHDNRFVTHGGVLFENCRAVDVIDNEFDVLAEGIIFNYYDTVATYGDHLVRGNDVHLTGTSHAEGGLGLNSWHGTPGTYTVLPNRVENNAIYGDHVWWAVLYGVSAAQTSTHSYQLHDNSIGGSVVVWGDYASTVLLDASGNWWGGNAASGVSLRAGSYVDYTPWLDSGTDTQSGTPGFQGDFSVLWVDDDSPQTGAVGRVQEGVNLVSGSTVNILPGLYEEQVVIDTDDVHLLGAGSGSDPAADTIIRSPVSLAYYFETPTKNYPVIGVHDATGVTVENLRVDGFGRGNGNYRFVGVAFWKAGGTVADCVVTGIRETPLSGNQHGVGIYAYNGNVGTYTVNVTDTVVADYQKNGMALNGVGVTANVTGCTTNGMGATGITAQNGVQIGFGAGGTVEDCAAAGHMYTSPLSWAAADLLFWDAGTVAVSGCNLGDANVGVFIIDADATITDTDVTFAHPLALWGVSLSNSTASKAAGRPLPQPFDEPEAPRPDKGPGDMTVTITGGVFQGVRQAASEGLSFYSDGAVLTGSISGATVRGWDYGITAYEDDPGVVSLTAGDNHILNNLSYGFYASGPTIQDAEDNDWGSGEGPSNTAGTYEVSSDDCGAPSVDAMLNIAPSGGLGNAVSENVDYCPWTVGALCTLTTADTCYKAGDLVTVDLVLSGATENITSGQWWIEFDATYLTYVGAAGQAPWDGYTVVNPGAWAYPPNVKFIQVGDVTAPLGAMSGTMLRLTFTANAAVDACEVAELVRFTNPLPDAMPTRLAGEVTEEIYPGLHDLAPITLDNTAPVAAIDVVGANVGGACTALVTFSGTVSDNCGIQAADVGVAVVLTTGNATLGVPTITKTQTDAKTVTITGSVAVSALTGCPATVQVTVTATDCGGNLAVPAVDTGDVNDVTPPVITGCPANISVPADAGACTAVVTWTAPTASDNCSVASFTSTHNPGDTFPVGTTTVTYTATDQCNNTTSCSFTVEVRAETEVKVNIELRGAASSYPFTRCITFEFDPGNVTVSQVVSFVAGRADNVIVTVPITCPSLVPFNCVRARDPLHTLWAAQTPGEGFGIVGTQYVADFTDDGSADNRLVLGNLNQDPWVDVIDFGIYVVRFGQTFDLDTDCTTTGRHPNMVDLSLPLDLVDSADFSVISAHFALADDTGCGTKSFGGRGPVTRISVEDLKSQGLEELIPADLNGDGWLDTADMEAFAAGALPARPGDLNADGVVNFEDIDAFVLALQGEAAYRAVYPQGRWLNGDLNGDGAVTFDDIDLLVARLQQP